MISKSQIVKILRPLLESKAEFAYLFGSHTAGTLRPDSDIDIGVFFKTGFRDFRNRIDFKESVEKVLDRDTDIISLNDCDTIIAMQIISNGELFFCKNESERLLFVLRTLSQYQDLKLTRKIVEDNMMKGGIHA